MFAYLRIAFRLSNAPGTFSTMYVSNLSGHVEKTMEIDLRKLQSCSPTWDLPLELMCDASKRLRHFIGGASTFGTVPVSHEGGKQVYILVARVTICQYGIGSESALQPMHCRVVCKFLKSLCRQDLDCSRVQSLSDRRITHFCNDLHPYYQQFIPIPFTPVCQRSCRNMSYSPYLTRLSPTNKWASGQYQIVAAIRMSLKGPYGENRASWSETLTRMLLPYGPSAQLSKTHRVLLLTSCDWIARDGEDFSFVIHQEFSHSSASFGNPHILIYR
ncbi:hypothetical protein Tco_1216652 [Tanacetum coccineum]